MTRAVRDDVCFKWNTNQCKITDYIQQLMSRRLVRKTKLKVVENPTFIHFHVVLFKNLGNSFHLVFGYNLINNNDCIINITTFYQVVINEVFEFVEKTKRSAWRYFFIEIRNMFDRSMLCSQHRRIKIN